MQTRVGETSPDEGLWEGEPAELHLPAALTTTSGGPRCAHVLPAQPLIQPELPGAIQTHNWLPVVIRSWLARPSE